MDFNVILAIFEALQQGLGLRSYHLDSFGWGYLKTSEPLVKTVKTPFVVFTSQGTSQVPRTDTIGAY